MARHSIETFEIKPPTALRPRTPETLEEKGRRFADYANNVHVEIPRSYRPHVRPVVLGATIALVFGFVFDIGPWSSLTGRLLGTAGAQEAPGIVRSDVAVPSEADRAALRYFAREGDVERLEAELRRLRALYPDWQPPRDLLDPQSEDRQLQQIWALVGNQQYDEARQAIAQRRESDPQWNPPERLLALLELAEVREQLTQAAARNDYREVLRIAEANEQILTCEDPASLWSVAEAFAETGRPQRAFDAYAYVVNTCEDPNVRAASLQKAAENLDPTFITQLFELGESEDGTNDFEEAQLDIIRGAVARGGEERGVAVPVEWLELLASNARTGDDLEDAMLLGYYLFRSGNPFEAAEWFRFALDNGLGADAAEGYIIALRATENRENDFLAREVAYQWREQTPELMEAYLDAMATILTADNIGVLDVFDVEQASVDRFVPVVIQQRDANGAQALGWYAFNTCQFIIAEEWFISSANWVPTEPAIYGLALSRLRLGDEVGFNEVVEEWAPIYPSVRGLITGEAADPLAPVTGDIDDPTNELGLETPVCDPAERELLRQFMRDQADLERFQRDPLILTEAGSLTSSPIHVKALASRPAGSERPEIPRRSVVIRPVEEQRGQRSILVPVQNTVPSVSTTTTTVTVPASPPPAARGSASPRTGTRDRPGPAALAERRRMRITSDRSVRPIERRTTVVSGGNRALETGGSTVSRRVRTGQVARSSTGTLDARVRRIVEQPAGTTSSGGGGTAAQSALANRQFSRCVAITNKAVRNGTLSPRDAAARGFCLLSMERYFEAAQAFRLARIGNRFGSTEFGDAVYGSTLAAIAANLTDVAAIEATKAPLSRARRTELQISILTQRAIAANRDGRYTEALYYLDQRNRIAPLQKDLMLLQGFAYLNAGDRRAANRVFRAVNSAGPTPESRQAVAVGIERDFVPQIRPTYGPGFR